MDKNKQLSLFDAEFQEPLEGITYQGRHTIVDREIYFPVVDLIAALTDSKDPSNYWSMMQRREKIDLSTICRQLKIKAKDGKGYRMDCVNLKNALRLVQSIPSAKAEPIKQKLAEIAYERIQELADPDLAFDRGQDRAIKGWTRQGKTPEWIEQRIKGKVEGRRPFTEALKADGVESPAEFAKFTNIAHTATFGTTVKGHKELKNLPSRASLRDNMIESELMTTNFGEHLFADMLKFKKEEESREDILNKHADIMKGLRESIESKTGRPLATAETPTRKLRGV